MKPFLPYPPISGSVQTLDRVLYTVSAWAEQEHNPVQRRALGGLRLILLRVVPLAEAIREGDGEAVKVQLVGLRDAIGEVEALFGMED